MSSFITNKTRFLHIPKTGGRFLTDFFNQRGMLIKELMAKKEGWGKHADLEDTMEYKDLYTWVVIRHPIAWYQSVWASRIKRFNQGDWKDTDLWKEVQSNKFITFIENCIEKRPGYYSRLLERFLYDDVENQVNFVCYYEALSNDVIRVFEYAKEPFPKRLIKNAPIIPKYTSPYEKLNCDYTRDLLLELLDRESYVLSYYR